MNELINQFINEHNNKFLDVDGGPKNQCVDLAKSWQDKLGIKRTTGNAINWLKNCDKTQWDVYKAPGTPTTGSLIVFGSSYGKAGHIALYVNSEGNRFNSFEQNNPIGSKCHMVNHSYNGVIGWMTPKQKGETMTKKQWVDMALPMALIYWGQKHPGTEPSVDSIINDLARIYDGGDAGEQYRNWQAGH
jgi:hypothetical protein